VLHGHADAGLAEFQLRRDVDGAQRPVPLLEDQDGLQIIFRRFSDLSQGWLLPWTRIRGKAPWGFVQCCHYYSPSGGRFQAVLGGGSPPGLQIPGEHGSISTKKGVRAMAATVLLYNFTGERGRKIALCCLPLGIRPKQVGAEDYGEPVGALAGLFHKTRAPAPAEA